MTYEIIKIVESHLKARKQGLKTVLATLVALDGSSYRRPGVRMLIAEDGTMIGAVSGGCVEKEVLNQSRTVFDTDTPKIMTYDGRYRLGCEGILYILIEPFAPNTSFLNKFDEASKNEVAFQMDTYYNKHVGINENWGTEVLFSDGGKIHVNKDKTVSFDSAFSVLSKTMEPCFKLIIIGGEHDAVQLCTFAALLGWSVTVIVSISDPQTINDFSGAQKLLHMEPENIKMLNINQNSAVVLMTHSYVRDLKYLTGLKEVSTSYIGILGPKDRKAKILNEFIEMNPEIDPDFLDLIYGPVGLNIGSETPPEIALSICSEILSIVRGKDPISLSKKVESIHSELS